MENITGKKALVTGGARGLGKATAVALAKEGLHVDISGRNEEQLKLPVKELQDLGVTATYAVFDVSNLENVQLEIE